MLTRSLPLLAALLTACAAVEPVPPAFAAPPPVAPPPAPVQPTPPAPDPTQDTDPRPTGGTLRLTPAQAEVKLGGRVQLNIENVGKEAFRYHHPGGTSGCAAFSWRITLVDAQGKALTDRYEGPDRMCTAVMVPPSWIVIEPGQSAGVSVDTGMLWNEVPVDFPRKPQSRELSPGRYEVHVSTPAGELRSELRVLPKK
jgi:hypothetical protein